MTLKSKLIVFATLLFFLASHPVSVFSADEAEFSLYPGSGNVDYEESFNLDILIDTKGEDVIEARAVLSFDPSVVKVVDAERNEDLFCNWPEDGQEIDNEQGVLMATGFCQSPPYSTEGEEDVFARLTLEPQSEGPLNILWEYSGRDEPDKSVIMADASPPQNILFGGDDIEPDVLDQYSGNFTVESPHIDEPTEVPKTGIIFGENSSFVWLLGTGFCLASLGVYIYLSPFRQRFSKSSTVVLYGKNNKRK